MWVCCLLAVRRASFGSLGTDGLARTMRALGFLVLVSMDGIMGLFRDSFEAAVAVQS